MPTNASMRNSRNPVKRTFVVYLTTPPRNPSPEDGRGGSELEPRSPDDGGDLWPSSHDQEAEHGHHQHARRWFGDHVDLENER